MTKADRLFDEREREKNRLIELGLDQKTRREFRDRCALVILETALMRKENPRFDKREAFAEFAESVFDLADDFEAERQKRNAPK